MKRPKELQKNVELRRIGKEKGVKIGKNARKKVSEEEKIRKKR